MNHLIIFAHPSRQSFNGAILETLEQTLTEPYKVCDLYADGFDPILSQTDLAGFRSGEITPDILEQQALVHWADHLIFIYPVWWYDRPAILKGWVDRVLSHNFAYGEDPLTGDSIGLLMGKTATIFSTFGSTQDSIAELSPRAADWSLDAMAIGTLAYCGFEQVKNIPFYGLSEATPEQTRAMLESLPQALTSPTPS